MSLDPLRTETMLKKENFMPKLRAAAAQFIALSQTRISLGVRERWHASPATLKPNAKNNLKG